MANNNVKKLPPRKELTAEEKKELLIQAYVQKKAALAEGILMSLVQNPSLSQICDDAEKSPVQLAEGWAKECMEVIYQQKLDMTEEAE